MGITPQRNFMIRPAQAHQLFYGAMMGPVSHVMICDGGVALGGIPG